MRLPRGARQIDLAASLAPRHEHPANGREILGEKCKDVEAARLPHLQVDDRNLDSEGLVLQQPQRIQERSLPGRRTGRQGSAQNRTRQIEGPGIRAAGGNLAR